MKIGTGADSEPDKSTPQTVAKKWELLPAQKEAKICAQPLRQTLMADAQYNDIALNRQAQQRWINYKMKG